MKSKMEKLLWKAYFESSNLIKNEDGDSNMVAVIVLIVIVLAVAAIFRQSLMDAVQTVMDNFTEFIES